MVSNARHQPRRVAASADAVIICLRSHPPLDPLSAPGRSAEGIGEELSLARHLFIPELHRSAGPQTPMVYQGDGYEALAGYADRGSPRLTVDTHTLHHRDGFHARQLDHPQRMQPNVDQGPSECSALPSS